MTKRQSTTQAEKVLHGSSTKGKTKLRRALVQQLQALDEERTEVVKAIYAIDGSDTAQLIESLDILGLVVIDE